MKYSHTITPEELERIEKFLSQDMSAKEAQAFAQELKTDVSLREKTEELRLLLLGINEVSLEQKIANFHQEIRPVTHLQKNARIIPFGRKLLVAASIVALVALGLWWLLQNGDSNKKIYSKYYTPDPGLATIMGGSSNYSFEKAMVEYKDGKYGKALEAWTSLLNQKPGNDTLIYFIGAAHQASHDLDAGMEQLEKVAANPTSAFYKDACWYLGLSYLEKGDAKKAIGYLEKSDHPQSSVVIKSINR